MAFGSMLNKAKDVASKASDVTKDAIAAGDVVNKITELANNLNESLPILAEHGYVLNELEVEVGVIPKVVLNFNVPTEEITEEKKDEVLAELKNNKLATIVVNSLFQATKIQNYVKVGNLKFAEVEIEVSIPPIVKIKFQ